MSVRTESVLRGFLEHRGAALRRQAAGGARLCQNEGGARCLHGARHEETVLLEQQGLA